MKRVVIDLFVKCSYTVRMAEFSLTRCIYCCCKLIPGKNVSGEDIIPRFIGGFYRPPISCKKCNNELGHETDAQWRKNLDVVSALEAFEMPVHPRVYKETQGSAPRSDSGTPLYELIGFGKTKAPFTVAPDGKTVTFDRRYLGDWEKACSMTKGVIKKKFNLDEEEVNDILEKVKAQFDTLAENDSGVVEVEAQGYKLRFDLTSGTTVGEVNMLDHFKAKVPARCVVKIAYSSLACLIGEKIFDSRYDTFRDFLKGKKNKNVRGFNYTDSIDQRAKHHVLGIRVRHGRLYVYIALFGHIGFVLDMGPGDEDSPEGEVLFDLDKQKTGKCHLSPEAEKTLDEALEDFSQYHSETTPED